MPVNPVRRIYVRNPSRRLSGVIQVAALDSPCARRGGHGALKTKEQVPIVAIVIDDQIRPYDRESLRKVERLRTRRSIARVYIAIGEIGLTDYDACRRIVRGR